MKINYRNTALQMLENPKGMALHTPDEYATPLTKAQDYKLLHAIIDQFSTPGFASLFNNKIQYITQPFYEAYRKAEPKLKEIVLKTVMDDSGTFIFQWPHHTQTIFYRIKSIGNGDTKELEAFILMLTKTPKNDSYAVDLSIYLEQEKNQIMDVIWKGFADQGRDLAWWVADLMLMKTFMQYAEVETKIVPAKRKENHVGVKYVNETNNNVEIMDSTYFTTISRTEGFGVRGHFRFQPFGIGLKEKRLIWISDFEKKGYHRKAKILNNKS